MKKEMKASNYLKNCIKENYEKNKEEASKFQGMIEFIDFFHKRYKK